MLNIEIWGDRFSKIMFSFDFYFYCVPARENSILFNLRRYSFLSKAKSHINNSKNEYSNIDNRSKRKARFIIFKVILLGRNDIELIVFRISFSSNHNRNSGCSIFKDYLLI